MQNRYAFDIGDYSKFKLLEIFRDKKIGLNWFLYPDESHNNDGKYIEYLSDLKKHSLEKCDVAKLMKEGFKGVRSVRELEKCVKDFFNIDFYYKFVPSSAQEREKWFEESLKKLKDSEVYVIDADNGLEVKSVKYGTKRSGKYIYHKELERVLDEGFESVIVYQHYRRVKNFREKMFSELKEKYKNYKQYNLYAVSFHKISPRVYFIFSRLSYKQKLLKLKQFEFWDIIY